MVHFVYALCEPRFPLEPRYVGLSKSPVKRWSRHEPVRGGESLAAWLASLKAKPFMVLLETCANERIGLKAEAAWIVSLVELGFSLLNVTGNPTAKLRRERRVITHEGRTQAIAAWARELGISRERLRQRLMVMPVEVALSYRRGESSPLIEEYRKRKEAEHAEAREELDAIAPVKTIATDARTGLTHAERRERRRLMASLHANGETIESIANRFSVTTTTVISATREFRKDFPPAPALSAG